MKRAPRILITTLIFIFCWILFPTQSALAQNEEEFAVGSPDLRQFLLELQSVDQGIREELAAKGYENLDSLDVIRQQAVDRLNQEHLKKIIDRNGWPTRYLVGEDGVNAAFLIIQHADSAFQREMYPVLEESFENGDLTGSQYALITDRVLVNAGKKQRYGTQAQIAHGKIVLDAIENPEGVNDRRALLGLQTLSEYIRELEDMYGLEAVIRL